MASSFDFGPGFESPAYGTPLDFTPTSQRSPQKSQESQRWSGDSSTIPKIDFDKAAIYEAPPIPPIPPDEPPEAWRRRSMKRDSYTSQMSLRQSESGSRPHIPLEQRTYTMDDTKTATFSIKSVRTKRTSRTMTSAREENQYDELHWQVSGLNPKAWRRRKKWIHTIAAGSVAFTVLFASSIVGPGRETIEQHFDISANKAVLPTTLFAIGLAFGPAIGIACSTFAGRKITQLVSLVVFAALTVASAFAQNLAIMLVCRLLAGIFASPALWLGIASLFDTWTNEELGAPFVVYSALALSGLVLGPTAGGSIAQSEPRTWKQYTILLACAVALPFLLATRETQKETIVRRARLQHSSPRSFAAVVHASFTKPISALFYTAPTACLGIYIGCVLGTFYAICTAFPAIYGTSYDFTPSQQGVTFVAMFGGVVLGAALLLFHNALIYQPRVARWRKLYDAELERAAAEEKLKRRSRRTSRASTRMSKRKSTQSLFTSQSASRLSLIPAAKKHDSTLSLNALAVDSSDKNVTLSIAAAKHLNSANQKCILPERILLMLSKSPPFGELCDQLEWYGLKVDRVEFAKVLLDALQNPEPRPEITPACPEPTYQPGAAPQRPDLQHSSTSLTILHSPTQTFTPPPCWRLWPALPASVLISATVFLSAWTVRASIHWVVSVVGMALFAIGLTVVAISTIMYLYERHGADAVAGASIVSWILAGVWSVAGQLLFDNLGTGWAGSVFAFVCLGTGVVVWVIALKGRR